MKLSQHEKDIVRKKFCVYCIKVLHGEALNYLNELNKLHKYEINFSELPQEDLKKLSVCDDDRQAEIVHVMDTRIVIHDEEIYEALMQLPDKKRQIILMLFFMDMTEKEIANCLKIVQSTVHYHKDHSLKVLKDLLKGRLYE